MGTMTDPLSALDGYVPVDYELWQVRWRARGIAVERFLAA